MHYIFFPYTLQHNNNKGVFHISTLSTLTVNRLLIGLLWSFALQLCGKRILHLYNTVAKLFFSRVVKIFWRVTVWLQPGVVLDLIGPNCGREAEQKSAENEHILSLYLCKIQFNN